VNLSVRRYRGLSELKSLLGSNEIEFNGCGGIEIFKSKSDLDFYSEKLTKWNNLFLSEFKADVYSIKKANNFRGLKNIAGAIMNEFEGSLNTGKMIAQMRLKALSLGVEIYNGVNVLGFSHSASGVEINSSAGTWRAEQVIFCVNAFANNFGFQFDIQPKRNQVIVSKEMNHYLEATYHAERGYIYFRPIGKRILIGGMRHLFPQTENTINFGNTDEVITALSDYASEVVVSDDNFEIDMQWSGIIAMGTIKKPIVERINSRIGIAVRMGGMGVAIGTSVGREISTLMMQ
jgi:glycine/D-amino acid oxidase-like deaminating enzyme